MTAKDLTDAQLVARALDGDVDSFGELYRRYYKPMVAIGYAALTEHNLAEDAAQASFAIACEKLDRLRKADKFSSWLAAICRNTARDMIRRKINISAIDAAAVEQVENDESDVMATRQIIDGLGDAMKEIIVLRFYDNLSYEKIAKVLGISTSAVHGRLVRAKRKIAKRLKQNNFTGADYEA